MELFRVTCSKGQFVVTESAVIIEFANKRDIYRRDQISHLQSMVTSPKFWFAPGTSKIIIVTTAGQRLEAGLIRTPIANQIMAELSRVR